MPEEKNLLSPQAESPKPRKKGLRFGHGLLIYAIVLLLLGGAGLYQLRDFVLAYEASRPRYHVEAYEQALHEQLPRGAEEAISRLDPQVQSPDTNRRWAQELLRTARLVKDSAESTEEELVYRVLAEDGQQLGRVRFASAAAARYKLPVWTTAEEEFDFSAYYRTTGVTVPSDYQVYLGERLLDGGCIAEDAIPYRELEECYLHYDHLPVMVRYESPPFVVEPELRILDQDGKEVSPEQLNELSFLDRCPEEVRERADAFTEEFIYYFINFTADINEDSTHYYFNELRRMSVRDSQIYTWLRSAFEGFGWSATRSVTLKEVHIDHISVLGQGRYLADVRYVTGATGYGGKVELNDHIQLVLVDRDGKLLADALYYAA